MERKIIMSITLRKFSALFAPLAVLALVVLAPLSASAQFADQATYIAAPGGTANAITLAVDNWSINRPGVPIRFLPASQNTGATTVVVNGVGSPIAIKKQTGNGLIALTGGEINTSEIAEIVYDGTQWELRAPPLAPVPPGGYLTPCQVSSPSPVSGCTAGYPVVTGDVTSATTLFYAGMTSNSVPIFNGGQFIATPVTESQMTLILSSTANTANNIYDVCIYSNAGTPAIGTMPAWSNSGAGSGARSAAIAKVQGIWLNSGTVTVTNNNVGVSVAANRCTVIASILIDSVNGQVTLQRSAGQNRRWAVWNFYNRLPIILKVTDATASWTYTTQTWRPANGSTSNSLRVFSGLPEEPYTISTSESMTSTAGAHVFVGVGFNNTAAPSGKWGAVFAQASGFQDVATGSYIAPPSIGINVVTALEESQAANITTWYGTEQWFLLTASWRG